MQQDMSIKEAGSLFARAARGGGYSWGAAEEVGYAAVWLAKAGLLDSGLQENIAGYLAGDFAARDLTQQGAVWGSASGQALCPISVGCYLADLSHDGTLFDRESISLKSLVLPVLIWPFVARMTWERSLDVELSWKGRAQGGAVGLRCGSLLSPVEGADMQDICSLKAHTLTINLKPDMRLYTASSTDHIRVTLAQQQFAALSELAIRTHVPETEALQLSGAGDNF